MTMISILPAIRRAADSCPLPREDDNTFQIAEFGMGTGMNGMAAVAEALPHLESRFVRAHSGKLRKRQSLPQPFFVVSHVDTPQTDFSSLFNLLSRPSRSYLSYFRKPQDTPPNRFSRNQRSLSLGALPPRTPPKEFRHVDYSSETDASEVGSPTRRKKKSPAIYFSPSEDEETAPKEDAEMSVKSPGAMGRKPLKTPQAILEEPEKERDEEQEERDSEADGSDKKEKRREGREDEDTASSEMKRLSRSTTTEKTVSVRSRRAESVSSLRQPMMRSNVFPHVIGRSLVRRLFPDQYLHLGFSISSLQFLSTLPTTLKSSVFSFSTEVSPIERLHFERRAHDDLLTFLYLRAAEFLPGGQLVIVFPSASESGAACVEMVQALEEALRAMVAAGRLTREQMLRMTLPYHCRTIRETKETLLELCHLWRVRDFHVIWQAQPAWEAFERGQLTDMEYARECVRSWEATTRPSFERSLKEGDEDTNMPGMAMPEVERVLDEIYQGWADRLYESTPPDPMERPFVCLRLERTGSEAAESTGGKRRFWLRRWLERWHATSSESLFGSSGQTSIHATDRGPSGLVDSSFDYDTSNNGYYRPKTWYI
ncbi:uncharacterized protein VTP21DRAFT_11172 [Calcarisporiella thermophila]|uniref:uncharacterized protein n=1 Tax=Calcarisporiella thermophila TaxID=911321 RepID=UPI0037430924